MKNLKTLIVLLFFAIQIGNTYSQNLDLNEGLLKGKLDNGLNYYIKKNKSPKKHVELRLIVHVGSLAEQENEQGFAHFVEHMCFNGTKNFPGNKVISYLESKGMRFGRQFNAYTSFAETVYMLSVPYAEHPELLQDGFQVLEDWAHQLTFDVNEIEKERGVILQEMRTGQGSVERLRDQYYPYVFRGAQYQNRLPIGKKDVLENFHPDELINFYTKWYRPELMSMLVIGDIEPEKGEELVKKYFGSIKKSDKEIYPEVYPVSDNDSSLFVVCTDKEASSEMIRIYYLEDPKNIETEDELKESVIDDLLVRIMNRRFQEINHLPDASFIYMKSNIGPLVRTKDALIFVGEAKTGKVSKAVTELYRTNRQFQLYGFTETELNFEKKILSNYIENKENEETESRRIATKLTADVLRDNNIYDASEINQKTLELIPTISLAEINKKLQYWLNKKPIVSAMLPDSVAAQNHITEEYLSEEYLRIEAQKPLRYESKELRTDIDVQIDKEGDIVSEKYIEELGVTELILSNGSKVILKPTTFKNDEVLFTSVSCGGYSQYTESDYISALLAFKVAFMSGLGDMSFSETRKLMALHKVKIAPSMNEYTEGVSGSSTRDGVEFLLKLNYAYYNQLEGDLSTAKGYISRRRSQMESMQNDPNQVFTDTILSTLYGADSRKLRGSDPEEFDKFDLSRANEIIKERFANPSDFTYIMVGNFEIETVKPFIKKYIASIQGNDRKDIIENKDHFKLTQSKDITVYSGKTEKSYVKVSYFGDMGWNADNRSTLKVLTEILKIKLRKALREDKSGVYGVRVESNISDIPENYFKLDVSFGCSTAMVDTLLNEARRQIELISKNEPDKEIMDKVRTLMNGEMEREVKENGFWEEKLTDIYLLNRKADDEIIDYPDNINSVTAKRVKKMAAKYLTEKKRLIVTMYPSSYE